MQAAFARYIYRSLTYQIPHFLNLKSPRSKILVLIEFHMSVDPHSFHISLQMLQLVVLFVE